MKRLALIAPLLFACIDFNTELNNRLAMLDGGGGNPDAGTPDSGTADAGCPGTCLVTTVRGGTKIPSIVALPDGTFLAVQLTQTFDELGVVMDSSGALLGAPADGGAYKVRPFPKVPKNDGDAGGTDDITWPNRIALRGSSLAVADRYGYGTIIDLGTGDVTASIATCGYPEYQTFIDVAWADDNTAYFAAANLSGYGGHVCKWNRSTGFSPIDLGVAVDAGQLAFQSVALVAGELFAGDEGGSIYTTDQASIAAPSVWASSSTEDNEISSIAGTSANALWACGSIGFTTHGLLAKFNPADSSWVETPTPPPQNAVATFHYWQVLPVSATDLWLVGSYGNVLHSTGDGTWDAVTLPGIDATAHVFAVASHGPKDLALGLAHELPDGGSVGELLIYTR